MELLILGLALCVVALMAGTLSGAELEGNGFVDSYHSIPFEDIKERLISRTRLRYQGWVPGKSDRISYTFSFNATYNDRYSNDTGFDMRELFIDYSMGDLELRLGKQFIIWGKADGVAITDLICPKDSSEFLSRDYDDTRLPVNALKATLNKSGKEWQFVWIPRFESPIYAGPKSPWAFKQHWPVGTKISIRPTKKPGTNLSDSEFALKYSVYGHGIDYSFSLLHLWDDNPVYKRKVNLPASQITLNPEIHRVTVIGAEVAKAQGEFVHRAEGALHLGKRYVAANPNSEAIFKRDELNLMVGSDWSPGNDWEITGQLIYKAILDYKSAIQQDKENYMATLRVSKKLMRETLDLSVMNYSDLSNESGFVRFSSDYAFTDDLHVLLGTDIFHGNRGVMGQFDKNDGIWLKVKYSF